MCHLILHKLKKQVFSQTDLGKANSNVTAIAQAKLETHPDGKLKPVNLRPKEFSFLPAIFCCTYYFFYVMY